MTTIRRVTLVCEDCSSGWDAIADDPGVIPYPNTCPICDRPATAKRGEFLIIDYEDW